MVRTPLPQPGEPFDWNEAGQVVLQTLKSNQRAYRNYVANKTGYGFEPTPLEELVGSSIALDHFRHYLPERFSNTGLGRLLADEKPQWVSNSTVADKVYNFVQNLPLGGLSQAEKDLREEARSDNPEVLRNTIMPGVVQRHDDPLNPYAIGDRGRLRATQMAGVALGDFLQQGLPYIWWGLNAAPAVTAFATLNATHRAGDPYYGKDTVPAPLLKRRAGRMLMAAPAWIGMNLATGQFGRMPGYTAASPSATDATVASDPASEALSRVLLGRSGNLLPYDEFVKERPDVSRSEYEAYKAYLFGNKLPIKATLDGIHGPEVTFLGKSVPLATGILPAVAMALGARRGAKLAADRLASSAEGNMLDMRQQAYKEYMAHGGGGTSENHAQDVGHKRNTKAQEAIDAASKKKRDDAFAEYTRLDNMIENETLRQAIGYGSGAMAATALTGATLEALRRAVKGKAPQEELDESGVEVSAAGVPLS